MNQIIEIFSGTLAREYILRQMKTQPDTPPLFISVAEAGRELGLDPRTVSRANDILTFEDEGNMNIEEFFAANETIEFNPVKRVNARVKQICEQILPADLRPDVRVVIEGSRLAALHNRAKGAIERGRTDLIEPMLADFANDLRAALNFERTSGALKPWSRADALEPWLGPLEKRGWRGPERAAILAMLEQGEEPTAVDFRTVTTNHGRKITRDDVRAWALGQRPRWEIDLPRSLRPSEFLARVGFLSDEKIAELERVAERVEREAARPFSATSGPHAGATTVLQR